MRLTTSVAVLLFTAQAQAAHLSAVANRDFDRYVATVEARLIHRSPSFKSGTTRVEGGSREFDGALLHHWRGGAFVAGAGRQDMLALLRDYDHFPTYYAPEVVSARLSGGMLGMRIRKQSIITVVLDAEFEVQDGLDGPTAGYSFSRSTHIRQIREPGTPREQRRPEGDDDGFLWRLNSYWSFIQLHDDVRDGLLIECEAISLTRDIPSGLGWLIAPIVRQLPRTSLEFTLNATKNALSKEKHR
jgi:hypothetical protein